MKTLPHNKIQSPFKPEYLMDRFKFLNFCKKQGVNLSMQDLKWLYEHRIIVPAVRVFTGCLAVRKLKDGSGKYYYADDIEGKKELETLVENHTHYKTAMVVRSGKKWFEWYKERNMISFPSQEKEALMHKYSPGIFPSMKDVPDDSEVFYDKHQFIAVKLVIKILKITRGLTPEKQKMWENNVKKEVADFNKLLLFYFKIKNLLNEQLDDSSKNFEEFLIKNERHKSNTEKDLKAYESKQQKEKFQEKAFQLMQKNKYEKKDIDRWLRMVTNKSFLRDISYPFEFVKRYLLMIPENILREEFINSFAEDILCFRNLLNGTNVSFKDYLYNSFDTNTTCYICGTAIAKGRKLCNRKECKNAYDKLYKKNKRKVNPDYGR